MKVTSWQLAAALGATGTTIPLAFYEGVVDHESRWDLGATYLETNGQTALGLFQILDGEVQRECCAPATFLASIDAQAALMASRTEANRARIREAAGVAAGAPDPWDMGAYLALAHNQGIGAALKTIGEYGMDWDAYRRRNPGARIIAYGDDCLYDPLTGAPARPRRSANLALGILAVIGAGAVALLAG